METPIKANSFHNLSSPDGSPSLHVPSPIITRRTRTDSTSARAFSNPQEHGVVKQFSRSKGHGFIQRDSNGETLFVHISEGTFYIAPSSGNFGLVWKENMSHFLETKLPTVFVLYLQNLKNFRQFMLKL
ncbi:cold shock domain-containing protein CG9705 isoform X2 [Halyomorpha halys]|uniref:cold shock domain-containing protein CG9705 isoform X2 n=1 Tax=Halyomorpha halys TaxID=286706 RepID=UPI0034D3772E